MTERLIMMVLLVSLALLLVLLLRRPARRLFGAGPAFSLWLLPPALGSAAWLQLPVANVLPQLAVAVQASPLALLVVHPQFGAAGDPATIATHAEPWATWLLLLWLVGITVATSRLLYCHWKLHRQSRRPTADEEKALATQLDAGRLQRVRIHPIGPAVLCGWPSSILLPPNFEQRFTAQQRRLVLRHEQTHLRRGDPWWRMLAELGRALLWFHPLVWLAMPRFRIDQELACDAATLQLRKHNRIDYARTLLGDFEGHKAALVAGWIHPSQLKERLVMLKSHPIRSRTRRSGYALVLAVIATLSLAAVSALSVPQPAQAETSQVTSSVISINLSDRGIYWNGEKVTETSLQHRAIIAARINPQRPVLFTYSDSLAVSRADAIATTLAQSGLLAVDERAIDTRPLPDSDIAAGQFGRYKSYRSQRPPRYPPSAIVNREEGMVVLKVRYAQDGTTLGAKLESTDATTTLVKAALAAALTWRSNASAGDWGRIPINFQLTPFEGKHLDKLPDPPAGMKWQMAPDGKSIRSVPADANPESNN